MNKAVDPARSPDRKRRKTDDSQETAKQQEQSLRARAEQILTQRLIASNAVNPERAAELAASSLEMLYSGIEFNVDFTYRDATSIAMAGTALDTATDKSLSDEAYNNALVNDKVVSRAAIQIFGSNGREKPFPKQAVEKVISQSSRGISEEDQARQVDVLENQYHRLRPLARLHALVTDNQQFPNVLKELGVISKDKPQLVNQVIASFVLSNKVALTLDAVNKAEPEALAAREAKDAEKENASKKKATIEKGKQESCTEQYRRKPFAPIDNYVNQVAASAQIVSALG